MSENFNYLFSAQRVKYQHVIMLTFLREKEKSDNPNFNILMELTPRH